MRMCEQISTIPHEQGPLLPRSKAMFFFCSSPAQGHLELLHKRKNPAKGFLQLVVLRKGLCYTTKTATSESCTRVS